MSTKRSRNKSTPVRRKARTRGTPRWIKTRQDLDEVARRRCLMILSVLSGERPVTQVIGEAEISRNTYYQLEERALRAMIAALTPSMVNENHGKEAGAQTEESPARRIAQLEAKVSKLEQAKRRSERLLLLTRKVMKPGSVKSGKGRPPKRTKPRRSSSTTSGPQPSRSSKSTSGPIEMERPSPSMPTSDGEGVR
jgi:hypothetical protein